MVGSSSGVQRRSAWEQANGPEVGPSGSWGLGQCEREEFSEASRSDGSRRGSSAQSSREMRAGKVVKPEGARAAGSEGRGGDWARARMREEGPKAADRQAAGRLGKALAGGAAWVTRVPQR